MKLFIEKIWRGCFILLFVYLMTSNLEAQNVAVTDSATYEADASAMLDVQASDKGMLIPRLTSSQRLSIANPANGLLVYDENYKGFFFFNGIEWLSLSSMNATAGSDEALFHVLNTNGDTVFAVYNDGVEVTVSNNAKGPIGGFAVSGRNTIKGTKENVFFTTPDSTRVFINQGAKGPIGGFAVSGRNTSKGTVDDMFLTTADSTRVFVNQTAKGPVGGFAVSGRNSAKGTTTDFMNLTADNYFIGFEAGINTTPSSTSDQGKFNSFLGYQAGKQNLKGYRNILLGYNAGMNITEAYDNIFIGYKAGMNVDTAHNNVFLGTNVGLDSQGWSNIFIGDSSGYSNIGGYDNVFMGYAAGKMNQSGHHNVFIGSNVAKNNTGGFDNVMLGANAGLNNTEGSSNVFIGDRAGTGNTEASHNVYIGNLAAFNSSTGDDNIVIGFEAGKDNNSNNNVILGKQAAMKKTSGDNNIIIGEQAARDATGGYNNIMLGQSAGLVGQTAHNNIFIGNNSGRDHKNGYYNIFIGENSGQADTSGFENIYIGFNSGRDCIDGAGNVFLGSFTGMYTVDGFYNTFIGKTAGYHNIGGISNTFVGYSSGSANTSGVYNTYLGSMAGIANKTGNNNTIIGRQAARYDTLGHDNTMLGARAGFNLQEGSGNVFIGYRAGYNEMGSDKLYITNSSDDETQALIYGEFSFPQILRINGNVGIDKAPAEKLDVEGKTKTIGFQLTGGASPGYVLESDASGNGTWVNPQYYWQDNTTYLSPGNNWSVSNSNIHFYGSGEIYGMSVVQSSSDAGAYAILGDNSYQGCFAELGSGRYNGVGIYAEADGSDESAIYGYNASSAGWAGYFDGNLNVTGNAEMPGVYGDNVGSTWSYLKISSSGVIGTVTSKLNRVNTTQLEDATWIYNLEPVQYSFKDDFKTTYYGFDPDKTKNVNSDLVNFNDKSEAVDVKRMELIPALVKIIQQQKNELDQMNERVSKAERKNAELKQEIAEIKKFIQMK